MRNVLKVYISIGEFEYRRKNNQPYEGFVIGLGYAYYTVKTRTEFCQRYGEKPFYIYPVDYVQEIDITKEMIGMSFPEASVSPKGSSSAKVRTAWFALKNPVIASEIGEYVEGSTNISTNVVRFSTRSVDKSSPSVLSKGDGGQINAFRHVLWQSYITNKHGYEIAMQVGIVHEENPSVNLSKRRFSTLSDADQTIDLLNNQIGRSLGGRAANNTKMPNMALRVLNEFYENGLYTARKKR